MAGVMERAGGIETQPLSVGDMYMYG